MTAPLDLKKLRTMAERAQKACDAYTVEDGWASPADESAIGEFTLAWSDPKFVLHMLDVLDAAMGMRAFVRVCDYHDNCPSEECMAARKFDKALNGELQ